MGIDWLKNSNTPHFHMLIRANFELKNPNIRTKFELDFGSTAYTTVQYYTTG